MGAVGMVEYCCAEVGNIQGLLIGWQVPIIPHSAIPTNTTNHTNPSMSFDDSSSMIDQYLGAIYGESSTIPPSHSKKDTSRIPSPRPRGCIQPPHSAGFPRSPLKDKEEQMVPIVDTCLGYAAVLGAKLFNEQERMEEEVSSVFDRCQK